MFETSKDDLSVYYRRECRSIDVLIGLLKISGFRALFLYRVGNRLYGKRRYILAAIITRLIRFSCNMDIELTAQIGRRVKFPHPFAIVIGGNAKIGDDCIIMQCVTIGGNAGKKRGNISQPQIGSSVFLGAGAKLLGPVKVGNSSKIGANSVVLNDVPEGALAVGVPATIKS